MRFRLRHALGLIAIGLLSGATSHADTIRVGAAISLKDAMADFAKTYEAASGDTVEFTYGSSGQIQQQIKSGAAMDVFLSAANKQVDELAKDGTIDAASRRVIAMNALVLIVPADARDAPTSFADLAEAKVKKLAIGEPKTVPAGQYAEQVLKAMKLDAALGDRLVFGTNVRQVLTYVENGEVSAGLVYASDAKASGEKVKVVATADESTHEPIVYPGVVIAASTHKEAAKKFLDALGSNSGRDALLTRGFTLPAVGATSVPTSSPEHGTK